MLRAIRGSDDQLDPWQHPEPDVGKTQAIRLADIFLLGPAMVYVGVTGVIPSLLRIPAIVGGIATVAFNVQNYRRLEESRSKPMLRAISGNGNGEPDEPDVVEYGGGMDIDALMRFSEENPSGYTWQMPAGIVEEYVAIEDPKPAPKSESVWKILPVLLVAALLGNLAARMGRRA
jgi:hypothetical protein